MTQPHFQKTIWTVPAFRFLFVAASLAVLISALRAAESIVIPLLIATFLTVICNPIVRWLGRHHVPSTLAILIVVITLMIAMLGAGAIVGTSIAELRSSLPTYQERFDSMFHSAAQRLDSYGVSSDMLRLEQVLNPGSLMRSFVGGLLSVASFASNSMIVLFTLVLMLFEASYFDRKLHAMMRESENVRASVYDQVSEKIQKYMVLKTLVSLVTGLLVTILLTIVGVDLAVLWGFVAFLLNFIPNLGSIIAAVPAVLLTLIQLGPGTAIVVALGYLAINVLMGSIIELRLMGQTLGLSTLVVFLSLLFWGWLWGTVGALLSIPLTMIVKILLESSPSTRRIAIVLSDSASVERMLASERVEESPEVA